jgi:small subunit ribosomal protein S6
LRTYEATFIADPNLSDEDVDSFTQQMEKVVEGKNSKTVKIDRWGKRPLAFPIGKFRDGHVVIMTIEGDGDAIVELERRFKVTDFIIRYLTVRVDADLKRLEKLKTKRAAKMARRASSAGRAADMRGIRSVPDMPSFDSED